MAVICPNCHSAHVVPMAGRDLCNDCGNEFFPDGTHAPSQAEVEAVEAAAGATVDQTLPQPVGVVSEDEPVA